MVVGTRSLTTMKQYNPTEVFLPYQSDLVEQARELRRSMTPAERKLWNDYLKHFQFRILRQRPIDRFIVDFYCARLKLVIEVDGEVHNSEEALVKDMERTQRLESFGLTVIRFTNDQVLYGFEAVCRRIAEMLEDPP